MINTVKNPKTIAISATVLCVGSLLWLFSTQSVNSALESSLEQSKLRSEALLAEKLLLEKDIEKVREQLSGLKGINSELDLLVKSTEAKFSRQESELKNIRRQNASLAGIKKQREELLRLQSDLESQLQAVKASYSHLENENTDLYNTIAQLQEQNKLLLVDLNRAMFASLDRSQIEAVKGKKERLTVRAKRTNKLIANFEVPTTLQNVGFRVLDPKGTLMSDRQGHVVWKAITSDNSITASIGDGSTGNALRKIQMEFVPAERMQSGVYTIEILNDNLYVGSMNVKLR